LSSWPDGMYVSGALVSFYSKGGVRLEFTGNLKICGDMTIDVVDDDTIYYNYYYGMPFIDAIHQFT
jgi:hypothetical protein